MSITVQELDSMAAEDAAGFLRACCGAQRWVQRMVERRPYQSAESLRATANDVWRELGPQDWLEAFSHHPRIGERAAATPQDPRGAAWSEGEQAGAAQAGAAAREALAALAALNSEYEERFGHVFIVCATGRSAEEMLAEARRRLHNDPTAELRVAAEEQRKIMQIRLQKLLGERE